MSSSTVHDAASPTPTDPRAVVAAAGTAEAEGRLIEAVRLLQAANRSLHDADIEHRLVELRDRAVPQLEHRRGREEWPPVCEDRFPDTVGLPEVASADVDADTLASGIVHHGALAVRGLLSPEEVDHMIEGIDTAFDAYDDWDQRGAPPERTLPWFNRFWPSAGWPGDKIPRRYVRGSGGVWGADSPRLMFELVDLLERTGLADAITTYLGERPALSVKKCTFRRVPIDSGSVWHQDGAFMGDDLRTVNVWIALTDCGGEDSEVPALDVVPRRFDYLVETGTEGAMFDTFVGQAVVEREAGELGIQRPRFAAGDALLFDDLFLHATGVSPTMTRDRYAIESWFFAPSTIPLDQVPLVF